MNMVDATSESIVSQMHRCLYRKIAKGEVGRPEIEEEILKIMEVEAALNDRHESFLRWTAERLNQKCEGES